jgi:hybrid cluster-associated redox disulfide protein
MENTYVNGETLIGEIVSKYPESVEILLGIGMHCLGCPASQRESLAEACAVHGFNPQQVADAINRKIAEAKA